MLISERTKIADLLKHHPDALETIITLSPDFKKLRNPILRTLMAKRTTISMASKVGGCKPEDFFRALVPLGFETDRTRGIDTAEGGTDKCERTSKPGYLQNLPADRLIHFDVRAMLTAGADPLKPIQQKVKSLKPDEVLVIVNNFEPVPLIKLLEKQGFRTFVDHVDFDTIEIYFYKIATIDSTSGALPHEPETDDLGDWDFLRKRFVRKTVEIDVRHLEMPQPMMTILENLENLPQGNALYVSHKRIPVFLLQELEDREFDYRIKEVQDGEVYLLIFKDKQS